MASENRGIPTKYKGVQMRSRLEARWACFFELAGWSWRYEPLDLDFYVPDFELSLGSRSRDKMLVEVKPTLNRACLGRYLYEWNDDSGEIVNLFAKRGWEGQALEVGVDPSLVIGLVAVERGGGLFPQDLKIGLCEECGKFSFFYGVITRHGRGGYICLSCDAEGKGRECWEEIWNQACNHVQWKGAEASA